MGNGYIRLEPMDDEVELTGRQSFEHIVGVAGYFDLTSRRGLADRWQYGKKDRQHAIVRRSDGKSAFQCCWIEIRGLQHSRRYRHSLFERFG